MPEPKIDEVDTRLDQCLDDMKRTTKRFQAVADELDDNPACVCANGICECGERILRPPHEEVEDKPFRTWLNRLSFALDG
jgi:hypothetical protein